MLSSFKGNRHKHVPWVFFGLAALFGVIYWHLYADSVPALHLHYGYLSFEHVNLFSIEYFNFMMDKPNGYPVFLFLARLVTGNNIAFVNLVILCQLMIFLLSAWYLAVRFYYFSNRYFFSFFLLLLILGNPEIVKFCFLVMTESFMISLLLLLLGLSCQWATQTKLQVQQRTLILLSTCLGASILIRPICYAWIMATALVLVLFYGRPLFTWTERLKTLKIFMIPLLLCWILGASFQYFTFGAFKNKTVLSDLMLGKVAMLLELQELDSPSPFMKDFSDLYKPMHALVKQAKTSKMKYWITVPYTDLSITVLPDFKLTTSIQSINTQSKQAFITLCMHYPVKYLKNIAMNYIALWQFWELMTPQDIDEFSHFVKTYGPLRFPNGWQFKLKNQQDVDEFIKRSKTRGHFSPYTYDKSPTNTIALDSLTPIYVLQSKLNTYTTWPSFLLLIRTIMGLVFGMTLYFFWLTLRCMLNKKQSTPPLWAGLYGASLLQATYLITASVNTGFFRYSIVMWPAVVFIGMMFSLCFLGSKNHMSVTS